MNSAAGVEGQEAETERPSNGAFVQSHAFACALLAKADWGISSVRGADLWQTNLRLNPWREQPRW